MAMTVRRVVTGHDENGAAVVTSDERIDATARAGRPGVSGVEIWSTNAMPVDLSDTASVAQREGFVRRYNYVGTGQGSVIRVTQLEAGAARFMHRTETLDYAILLSGTCDLELDDGESVPLAAGDIVVQRGTMHAWVNRGSVPCVFAFVLLDATPAVAGGQELKTHYPVG
jgi:quercetin dioxygenase-like cupin family protein